MALLAGCDLKDQVIQEKSWTVDFVAWIFDSMVQYILFTPIGLFDNHVVHSLIIKFGMVGAGAVTVLGMMEGIRRMIGMHYTPIRQMITRYPIALVVSAFAPMLFYAGAWSVNGLVDLIGKLTSISLRETATFANHFHAAAENGFQSVVTFFFLAAFLWYMLRALLFHAQRWFGLLFNCVTTPFVMVSYIFKPYEKIFHGWLADTIQKFGVQVIHSLFLGLIAAILFTPNLISWGADKGAMDGINYMYVRLMLSVGGLHMMLHPPSWVQGFGKVSFLQQKLKGWTQKKEAGV